MQMTVTKEHKSYGSIYKKYLEQVNIETEGRLLGCLGFELGGIRQEVPTNGYGFLLGEIKLF